MDDLPAYLRSDFDAHADLLRSVQENTARDDWMHQAQEQQSRLMEIRARIGSLENAGLEDIDESLRRLLRLQAT